jgi:hypothetical protein
MDCPDRFGIDFYPTSRSDTKFATEPRDALPKYARIALVIAYHTGARKGEIRAIRHEQIDLKFLTPSKQVVAGSSPSRAYQLNQEHTGLSNAVVLRPAARDIKGRRPTSAKMTILSAMRIGERRNRPGSPTWMKMIHGSLVVLTLVGSGLCQSPIAPRFPENPLISVATSVSLGDNVNGPSVIRVPAWISHPLGRYYMYFAHHKGAYIRLAYANSLSGPWKIYEPGVLNVRDTIFYRPQPDPPDSPSSLYTHVASPEILIDEANKQLVMYVHGMWTDLKPWPADPSAALKWMRDNAYAQYTQTTVSRDGIHFQPRPGITLRTSYLRAFQWNGDYYGMARLGVLSKASDPLAPFELGPNPFDRSPYAGRVRHVAVLSRGDTLSVFFSAIGDAPEKILLSTIPLNGDWRTWKASAPLEVLTPQERYECPDLPVVPSKPGESEGPEHALRDPALFEENGTVILFYSVCGEQGIGAADVTALVR